MVYGSDEPFLIRFLNKLSSEKEYNSTAQKLELIWMFLKSFSFDFVLATERVKPLDLWPYHTGYSCIFLFWLLLHLLEAWSLDDSTAVPCCDLPFSESSWSLYHMRMVDVLISGVTEYNLGVYVMYGVLDKSLQQAHDIHKSLNLSFLFKFLLRFHIS